MDNKKQPPIILFDSDQAAQLKTVTGWVSAKGHFFGTDENLARYDGCTHKKCDCGELMGKGWLLCEKCRAKKYADKYLTLPYKEWDGKEYICLYDDDKYFWDEGSLIDYLEDNDLNGEDVRLVLCAPIPYQPIDTETIAGDSHEDWEPSPELEKKIDEFNAYLATLAPHSYTPGKIRTSYEYTCEANKSSTEGKGGER